MAGQRCLLVPFREDSQTGQIERETTLHVAEFLTDLGWFALAGQHGRVYAMTIGHSDAASARRALEDRLVEHRLQIESDATDWNPALRRQLQRYARGQAVDFSHVLLALPPTTDFQRAVLAATRRIPWGETQSYAEVAAMAGSPRAARAVGNVMAGNRVPIVIPCHRVVASGGKWGGFSAPQGVELKRQMLQREAECCGKTAPLGGSRIG